MEDDRHPLGSAHDNELHDVEDGGRTSQEEAQTPQIVPDSSDAALEIVLDGSELLNQAVGTECLQLSISFEKNPGTESQQNELADQLDGVELRVSLDGAQPLGVEVISSRQGDEELPQVEQPEVSVEDTERGPQIFSCEGHTQNASFPSSDTSENLKDIKDLQNGTSSQSPADKAIHGGSSMLNCEAGGEAKTSEKKRSREEFAIEGKCSKLRTVEGEDQETQLMGKNNATEIIEHSSHDSSGGRFSGQDFGIKILATESKESCDTHGVDDVRHCNTKNESAPPLNVDGVTEGAATEKEHARRGKRKKIAMILAYCGAGYQGMQKNPGAVTIEGLLEEALLKAGALPVNYDGNPRRADWMRAARTDKGVSAVGQVVSGLFYLEPPGFIERVNSHLPDSIRLLGIKRVTPTFCAKKFCDRRRYEYVIPTFALDPSAHRDREAVIASEGTEDAFIKCEECSERGRKIPLGKVFRGRFSQKQDTDACDDEGPTPESQVSNGTVPDSLDSIPGVEDAHALEIASSTKQDSSIAFPTSLNQDTSTALPSSPKHDSSIVLTTSPKQDSSTALPTSPKQASLAATSTSPNQDSTPPLNALCTSPKKPFHFGDAERVKLNNILSKYVGTHNFHNFTSRTRAEDPSAKRYIVSFEAVDVFQVGSMEFIRCVIVGQSFMLHQIRKMVGLAIAIFRGFAPESIIETALRRDKRITIPTAPELGLFLDECMYPTYNQKWYNTHEEVSQKGLEEQISQFKHSVIYPHMETTENKEGQMALFLHSLNDRNYSDIASARESASVAAALQVDASDKAV
ncbi:hypothetical protein KP509_09G069000 [Ceratopteris richardii]|uniref:Pseudouridine synthase I TruA alpha/beta domain-containing protein n=1 Tax=Ceratopteris richardii TaxID=49495 RepID=A0A8T2U7X4_CERRI|nr:hypothetical protein KP509_09G069000 [Ceratopteris richardii]